MERASAALGKRRGSDGKVDRRDGTMTRKMDRSGVRRKESADQMLSRPIVLKMEVYLRKSA